MNIKACLSAKTDDWSTPEDIYNLLTLQMNYYDPCPLNSTFDGLSEDWYNYDKIYVNPPYSDILSWVKKAVGAVKEDYF